MRCGRKDSQKVARLKPEHQENYALAFQGQNRALIQDHFTEGFTPKNMLTNK
jgi:hypothetical protein